MLTPATEVLNELDALIASRSILQHPFYRAWTTGALTREDLAVYARVYYPHVAAFPTYLRSAIARADVSGSIVKDTLEENLQDELRVPAPHNELWLQFAEAVGADADAVRSTPATAGAASVTSTFARLCDSGIGRALATLYAYESQQPAVSTEKINGLRQQYGITDDHSLAYFTVHAEADITHREGERRALEACLDAGEASREDVLDAASQALDAYWQLLDAVCAERAAAAA